MMNIPFQLKVQCSKGQKKYNSFRSLRASLQNLRVKFPLFFIFKRVCKTLPDLTILHPKTCVTDNMSDSL